MFQPNPCSILVISRPKLSGPGEHWGVLFSDGRVAHCLPMRGACVTSIEDFSVGKDIAIRSEVAPALYGPVMQRLYAALRYPRAYDLLSWNCESFANWLTGKGPESSQVAGWAMLVLLAIGLGFANR